MKRLGPWRQLIWWGLLAIIIGLPFHAFLITFISAHTPVGIALPLRYWKELIFAAMLVVTCLILLRDRTRLKQLIRDPLVWLIGLFAVLHLIIIMAFGGNAFPLILGLKINLGFLLLMLVVMATLEPTEDRFRKLIYAVLIPAGLVGLFALLQLTVLPRDFLEHFGYTGGLGSTNPSYYLIENSSIVRIFSTLWGPNQLGSYLVLPLCLSLWRAITAETKHRIFACIVFVLCLIALYGSQSRGAWIAAGVAIFITTIISVGSKLRYLIIGLAAIAAVFLGLLIQTHHLPQRLEIMLFHGVPNSGHTGYISSNTGHLNALTMGYDRLRTHPLGDGLEAAGRASEDTPGQLYTENFYLQLAVQAGYEGLLVFVAIIALVGWRLFRLSSIYPMALPLLASLIGLSVNNLVAHTWSDGATAWIWWGIAGLVLAGSKEDHS